MISTGVSALHFRFADDFELDLRAYQLRQAGRSLKLPRIPMEVLQLLLERHGELVTREQIVERVWGKEVFVDTDNSINAAIRKIRQVLNDDADNPVFLQTVTGRGHRFIAPVTIADSAPPEAAAVSEAGERLSPDQDSDALPKGAERDSRLHSSTRLPFASPSFIRKWFPIVGVAALITVAATAYLLWARQRSSIAASNGRMMLAVLPFENLSGDPSQDYFSDGLTEELITQVGRSDPNRLGVIARSSVINYKHHPQTLPQMGRALGAQFILEGSVRRDADEIRVNVQLVRARDQARLWAQQYDRQISNMLTLQTEIAATVGDEVQLALGNTRERPSAVHAASHTPGNSEAYELFLKGRFFLNKRTTSGLLQATEYFEQSVASDPRFARSYANLAQCYALMSGYTISPPAEYIPKARAAAVHALELDPNLAEAHAALAMIAQTFDWDFATAEKEYVRAIELDPNYATAHHWRAECLALEGRFDEALPEIDRARQLDPLSLIIATDRGAFLYFARRYDSAIQQLNTVLEMEPNFPRAHIVAYAYAQKGEYDSALLDLQRWRGLDSSPWIPAMKAYVYGRSGQSAQGREALNELEELCRNHEVDPLLVAVANIGMGNKDSAFVWLEKAYLQRSSGLNALKVDPLYDPLRSDPRFANLLRRMGFNL